VIVLVQHGVMRAPAILISLIKTQGEASQATHSSCSAANGRVTPIIPVLNAVLPNASGVQHTNTHTRHQAAATSAVLQPEA